MIEYNNNNKNTVYYIFPTTKPALRRSRVCLGYCFMWFHVHVLTVYSNGYTASAADLRAHVYALRLILISISLRTQKPFLLRSENVIFDKKKPLARVGLTGWKMRRYDGNGTTVSRSARVYSRYNWPAVIRSDRNNGPQHFFNYCDNKTKSCATFKYIILIYSY